MSLMSRHNGRDRDTEAPKPPAATLDLEAAMVQSRVSVAFDDHSGSWRAYRDNWSYAEFRPTPLEAVKAFIERMAAEGRTG